MADDKKKPKEEEQKPTVARDPNIVNLGESFRENEKKTSEEE